MPDPYCMAMVLCDGMHRDPATGKLTILGTFSTVTSEHYPTTLSFCVYGAITDANGEFMVKFQLVSSRHAFDENEEPLFSMEFPLNSLSPLAVSEMNMVVPNVPIPSPGVYHCELLHNGAVLMSRRLVAIQFGPSPDEGDERE